MRIPSVSADPRARAHAGGSGRRGGAPARGGWTAGGRGGPRAGRSAGGGRARPAPRLERPTCCSTPTTTSSRPGTATGWASEPVRAGGAGRPALRARRRGRQGGSRGALRGAARRCGTTSGVGVTVLVEGEEEIGSPTLPALLAAHRDRLAADVLVLADSTNWRIGVPALTTSLRGGVSVVVEVATLRHAVHNGVYGGPVPDALTALAGCWPPCTTSRGDVAVRGLVAARTPTRSTSPRSGWRADAGVLDGVRLIGSGSLTSRLWRGPALSVVGIDAPASTRPAWCSCPRLEPGWRCGSPRATTPRRPGTRWSRTWRPTPRGVRRCG